MSECFFLTACVRVFLSVGLEYVYMNLVFFFTPCACVCQSPWPTYLPQYWPPRSSIRFVCRCVCQSKSVTLYRLPVYQSLSPTPYIYLPANFCYNNTSIFPFRLPVGTAYQRLHFLLIPDSTHTCTSASELISVPLFSIAA